MPEFWDRPYGVHLHFNLPFGCGIHRPQDYDLDEESEHVSTCIKERQLRVQKAEDSARLHDALDLAARTFRSRARKPPSAPKRVRFTLDAAPNVKYFCGDESCGCCVGRVFRSEEEHDDYVRERHSEESGEDEEVPGGEDEEDTTELLIVPEPERVPELGIKRSGDVASSGSPGSPKRRRSQ